jgi:serine/threonine protein phosphatase PrpC
VVADGLGGHGGGATASRLAVDAVLASFRANPNVTPEALSAHLAAAHAAILRQQSEPALSQMRSTIVVLLADETTAVCGHIGDSRLYHFQAGTVGFQTIDHSVPGALAAGGSIPFDAIRFHEDRNKVLRSLGNDGEDKPAITERSLSQGDLFLLCTDGFWENVTELEMEADAAKAPAPGDWLKLMASRLFRRAKPDNDNFTALAVFFRSPTAPVARRGGNNGGKERRWFSLAEKLSWMAIAVLTLTLAVSLAAVLFPREALRLIDRARGLSPHGSAVQRQDNTGRQKPVK